MNPAELDALIHASKGDGEHGARNCPKCGLGYMRHLGRLYACVKCSWVEIQHPPWPKRTGPERAA